MQRLPRLRIKRADVGSKVIGEEDPRPTDLGTGNEAGFGAATQLFRMTVEKGCRFVESQRVHRNWRSLVATIGAGKCAVTAYERFEHVGNQSNEVVLFATRFGRSDRASP